MNTDTIVIGYSPRGIRKSFQNKISRFDSSHLVKTDLGDSFIAFGSQIEKVKTREGGTRLICGRSMGVDKRGSLSYDKLKNIVGSCVIIDIPNSIHLYTDPFNKIILYYVKVEETVIISNDLTALRQFIDVKLNVNSTQLIHHLIHSIPFNDDTLFKEIKTLPAHSIVQLSPQMLISSYIPISFFKNENEHVYERKTRIKNRFESNIDLVYKSYRKPFLTLTAGNDSRLMLATMLNHGEVASFTWGEETNDDVIIASRLSKMTNSDHYLISIDEIKNGLNNIITSGYDLGLNHRIAGKLKHTFLLNEVMKKLAGSMQYDVEINGVGGELLRAFYHGRISKGNRSNFYKDIGHHSRLEVLKKVGLFTKGEIENYVEWYDLGIKENSETLELNDDEYAEYIVHEYRFSKAWSSRYAASKMNNVDTVYPFLNLALLEDVYKLPTECKTRNKLVIEMIRRINRKMLQIPINGIDYRLARKIYNRIIGKKHQFKSTSDLANELLHGKVIQELGVKLIGDSFTQYHGVSNGNEGKIYDTLRNELKSQLVFRVIYAFEFINSYRHGKNVIDG